MPNVLTMFKNCQTADDVFNGMASFYRSHGLHAVSRAIPSASNPHTLNFTEYGFSTDWLAIYRANDLHLVDPIPKYALESGDIFLWQDIGKLTQLSGAERNFISFMHNEYPGYGLILPTYGHRQRSCLTIVGMPENQEAITQSLYLSLYVVAQQAHIRLDQIELANDSFPALSPRETEILFWIANGKSNTDVATILSLSTDTVGTYVRRLFGKLDVSDRTTAAIVGMQQGLIAVERKAA